MTVDVGDRVQVKAEHDIPAVFRGDKPTVGVVESIWQGTAIVHVPIGDDDPGEHSQAVPYPLAALEKV